MTEVPSHAPTGSNDVGYSDPTLISPEIDELAAKGIRLDTLYTWDWCAPSRGAMLSGRYASNTGFTGGSDAGSPTGNGTLTVFPLKYTLLPQSLKQAGYSTLMAGKWSVRLQIGERLTLGGACVVGDFLWP